MRSKIRWFTEFCNSHYVSHFAAFFIVARAKISVVENCHYDNGFSVGMANAFDVCLVLGVKKTGMSHQERHECQLRDVFCPAFEGEASRHPLGYIVGSVVDL